MQSFACRIMNTVLEFLLIFMLLRVLNYYLLLIGYSKLKS